MKHRLYLLLVGLMGSSSLVWADTPVPMPPAACSAQTLQTLESVPVDRFLETMGINVHVAQGVAASSYVEPLRYLGLRQIRVGQRRIDDSIGLAKATGVRLTVLSYGGMDDFFAALHKAHDAGVLTAIEGPNEPNNFTMTYQDMVGGRDHGWMPVAQYQRDLYARAKADPVLRAYPVLSPSEVGGQTENVGLQFLTIPADATTLMPAGTRYADFANAHNYVVGPSGIWGPNQAWQAADPVLKGRWDGLAANFGTTWYRHFPGYSAAQLADLPRVTTESGVESAGTAAGEARQALVIPQIYLAQFARGWRYTFIYQLRDGEGGGGTHGLFHGAEPKPAGKTVHNLTRLLADVQGDKAVPFTVRLGGPATAHGLAFTRGDGTHLLAVWNETMGESNPIAIDLGQDTAPQMFDIGAGTDPLPALPKAQQQCINVGPMPVILRW